MRVKDGERRWNKGEFRVKRSKNEKLGVGSLSFYSLASDTVLDLVMFGVFHIWHIKMVVAFSSFHILLCYLFVVFQSLWLN